MIGHKGKNVEQHSSPITVNSNVHLILANGCELNSTSYITGNGNLTIYSQLAEDGKAEGKLTIANHVEEQDKPAIKVGSLTINGGTITAEGCSFWANGNSGNQAINANTIVINGGNITAKSNTKEGIYAGNGSITINGGTVNVNAEGRGWGQNPNAIYAMSLKVYSGMSVTAARFKTLV